MHTLFVACAALGGLVLVAQLVLGLAGAAHGHDLAGGGHHESGHGLHDEAEGLDLLSVRALAAGIAFFGIAGAALSAAGADLWVATPAAAAVGGGAMVGVALAMRAMLRLEGDASVRVEEAIGQQARVYLTVPGGRAGSGKVHVTLKRRTVEYQAVTQHPDALPTGADVVIVDVVDADTVEVVGAPQLSELLDDHAR